MRLKAFICATAMLLATAPFLLHAQAQPAAAGAAPQGAAPQGAPSQGAASQGAPAAARAGGPPAGMCNAPCDPYPGKKKLLVVADVFTGYDHDSINHMMGVIEQIGRESGAYVTYLRTDSQLITKGPITVTSKRYAAMQARGGGVNKRNIDYFDAVMLLGSGDSTMSDQQKADLLAFIKDDGKGLVLGHAQGVNMTNWPEFGNLIGGVMQSEYPATGLWAKVVDPSWKSAAAFGKDSFFWADQWPVLTPEFKRGDVHTIIALDAERLTPEQRTRAREDNYLPIVWAKNYGKGRVFNFTGGHNDATLDDPRTRALLLEGIKWATGLVSEDATPDRK